jgi:hypothetical protein
VRRDDVLGPAADPVRDRGLRDFAARQAAGLELRHQNEYFAVYRVRLEGGP